MIMLIFVIRIHFAEIVVETRMIVLMLLLYFGEGALIGLALLLYGMVFRFRRIVFVEIMFRLLRFRNVCKK